MLGSLSLVALAPAVPSGHMLDWAIVLGYVGFSIWVGMRFAKRAGQSVEEYFLSGRSLPWWIAGTSMVATSFAADTPLVVSGLVRDHGIWKNWLWWCFAFNGALQVFLFSRWWRRGQVMTKAELVELRYGAGAKVLRGVLGVLHATLINTITMCWVLLAAMKILGVLFEVDELTALIVASIVALTYSWFAGFWGVVVTDTVQFSMAMVGAIALAVIAWNAVGGAAGIDEALAAGKLTAENVSFFPPAGPGTIFDASFWTVSVAAATVYLGVSWWAVEFVDGSGTSVQRISASRDDSHGMLAVLWYNVAHYALRPWSWILVGLASILVLPRIEVTAPVSGQVIAVDEASMTIADAEGEVAVVDLTAPPAEPDWRPAALRDRRVGSEVVQGEVVARTDSESAYVVMVRRYLPIGLFGLMAASLVAAFMSTIDTHVNLASSFFVNDVYRRFLVKSQRPGHYVLVARLASVVALAIAGFFAWQADSIRDLFLFFYALLGGVGPIYLLRWVWWRVRPSTEIAAMAASLFTTVALTYVWNDGWAESALSPDGEIAPEGRLLVVVVVSLTAAAISLLVTRAPDPSTLVGFYRQVRPIGAWGPVRRLCPELAGERSPARELLPAVVGSLGGWGLVFGAMLGLGYFFLGRHGPALVCGAAFVLGGLAVAWALRRLRVTDGLT